MVGLLSAIAYLLVVIGEHPIPTKYVTLFLNIIIIFNIVFYACHQHGFPRLFLAIRPYQSSLMASLLDSIYCLNWADEIFLLVGQHCVSRWRSPLENVAIEFVPPSPAMPNMSCSSYLDNFCDGR